MIRRNSIWPLLPVFCTMTACTVAQAEHPSKPLAAAREPKPDANPADRPNILWISLEDITPMMGCYGDSYAKTPAFDKLAKEGIRYTRAYSVAPVCSASRASIISGMYSTTLGTLHHRSNVRPPDFLKILPEQMRDAGYYTSNNYKEDYNMKIAGWNESSRKAHWRNRPEGKQPFFAVFNFTECHSSINSVPDENVVKERLNRLAPGDFHDPAKAPIPPYHPDEPEFRKGWARYYDAVTQVDYRAGDLIRQLKEDGLWDNTIVFVWADHGVGLPRGKHTLWEQGTLVPLIVRFPQKYQHLAPGQPGSVLDDLVCLLDLGPSVMKLAGIDAPDYIQGRALLCRGDAQKRDYVFAARDRIDTRSEMTRAVRDERYRYQRNFFPQYPFKPYEDFEFKSPVLKKWVELGRLGKLSGPLEMMARRFKPVEELYDSQDDPCLLRNVAEDPRYAKVLERMRGRLREWMIQTRDLGILTEAELNARTKERESGWDVGRGLESYERIIETANLQLQGAKAIPELIIRCSDSDQIVRYWATLSLGVACLSGESETIAAVEPMLVTALSDVSVDVRLTAAEALFNLGRYEKGLPVVIEALGNSNNYVQLHAANILDSQPPGANKYLQVAVAPLREAAKKHQLAERFGMNDGPFKRALKVITGEENFYRWGPGASGSPKSAKADIP